MSSIPALRPIPTNKKIRKSEPTLSLLLGALSQPDQHFTKAVQTRFKVFDDLLGQFFGFRQIIEIGEAFVLEPEYIQTSLITRDQLLVAEFTPTAFGVKCVVVGLR